MNEIKELIEQQGKAWDEYRKANDARLAEIEPKGAADPHIEEKTKKLNDALDDIAARLGEIEKKMARPSDGFADAPQSERQREYKAAFHRYITKGDLTGFDELRAKDVQISVDPDGGYAVPEELDREILKLMTDESPMRQVCKSISIGGVSFPNVRR